MAEPQPGQQTHSAFGERVAERHTLVRDIAAEASIEDLRVIAALNKVPRHHFVPRDLRDQAYLDIPLPIGHGQTISQPQIVAAMTDSVQPRPTDRCLEIGTGCGYQTAILAELSDSVFSIEYLPEVAALGAKNLSGLGYLDGRVHLKVDDGHAGWPEHAPFDVVLVTAAPASVPMPLLRQLAVGGRLIIPLGSSSANQELELWRRVAPGDGLEAFSRTTLMAVRFVPFLGEHAR